MHDCGQAVCRGIENNPPLVCVFRTIASESADWEAIYQNTLYIKGARFLYEMSHDFTNGKIVRDKMFCGTSQASENCHLSFVKILRDYDNNITIFFPI